jgi:hypothetical protein
VSDHAIAAEIFYSDAWHPVPALQSSPINLVVGAPAEGQESPPSSAALAVDNRSETYNPSNPSSVLYGLAGRNTPLRITADAAVRSMTEAASWRPGRSVNRTTRRTGLTGGGMLRRLQQGKTPLKSAISRAVGALSPVAYWPLKEGRDADLAASGITGGTPLTEVGVINWAAVDGPPGSRSPVPELVADGTYPGGLSAAVSMSSGQWVVDVPFRFVASANSSSAVLAQWVTDGTWAVGGWTLTVGRTSGGVSIVTLAAALAGSTSLLGDEIPGLGEGDWHLARVVAQQADASTVDVRVYCDDVLLDFAGISTTGTVGNLTSFTLADYGLVSPELITPTNITSLAVSDVSIWDTVDPALIPPYSAVTGWAGETAGDRAIRLGEEEGITVTVDGDPDDTQLMGAQPELTFAELLRDCATTDAGMLLDGHDEREIVLRPGRSLYNQDPALTLSDTGAQIRPDLVPVLDDRPTRNDVTVERRYGSTARAVQLTGPLNVSDPADDPDGVGRFDTRVTVNPQTDAALINHATWILAKGTIDEPRFPAITVDLDRAPALVTAVNALRVGDRLIVEDMDTADAPNGISAIILGWVESYPKPTRRLITFVCMPASVFEIGIVGASNGTVDLRGQAIDTDASTLQTGISSTDTALTVASTSGVVWTTDASDWSTTAHGTSPDGPGLFIAVGGETMRVTNIAGATSPQTFTVVRSVNGVIKSHAAGAPVHARYPARVGL